jgi:hypothetical protein
MNKRIVLAVILVFAGFIEFSLGNLYSFLYETSFRHLHLLLIIAGAVVLIHELFFEKKSEHESRINVEAPGFFSGIRKDWRSLIELTTPKTVTFVILLFLFRLSAFYNLSVLSFVIAFKSLGVTSKIIIVLAAAVGGLLIIGFLYLFACFGVYCYKNVKIIRRQ